MLPKTHVILGLLFSISLYFTFKITLFEAFLVLFSSIFIDFDHYLWYIFKKRDLSLKSAYSYFKEKRNKFNKLSREKKKKHKMPYLIFHVIEFWALLFLFSLTNKYFIFILIGIALHMFLDYIEIIYRKNVFYFKFSLIWTYIKNRKRDKHFF